jgi:hypothetical protein
VLVLPHHSDNGLMSGYLQKIHPTTILQFLVSRVRPRITPHM